MISLKNSKLQTIPQTGFLLQVWGGLGLIVLSLFLFGINAWVWHNTKINYTFIFEFDTRHHLDYRQYLEVSSLLKLTDQKVAGIISISGMCPLLVDIQKHLASAYKGDMVSINLRLHLFWNIHISLPYPSSIQSRMVCHSQCMSSPIQLLI